jgi:hypothetical protein
MFAQVAETNHQVPVANDTKEKIKQASDWRNSGLRRASREDN